MYTPEVFSLRFWQPVSGVIDAFVDDSAAYKISHVVSEATGVAQTRYQCYINYIHVYTADVDLFPLSLSLSLSPSIAWLGSSSL